MSNRDEYDLWTYAKTLANGNAGQGMVRRLGEYVDYNTDVLAQAVRDSVNTVFCLNRGCYAETPCSTCKGITHALTMALGDAEDRAYKRRQQRRR